MFNCEFVNSTTHVWADFSYNCVGVNSKTPGAIYQPAFMNETVGKNFHSQIDIRLSICV